MKAEYSVERVEVVTGVTWWSTCGGLGSWGLAECIERFNGYTVHLVNTVPSYNNGYTVPSYQCGLPLHTNGA